MQTHQLHSVAVAKLEQLRGDISSNINVDGAAKDG
jgi:hypothetical protein